MKKTTLLLVAILCALKVFAQASYSSDYWQGSIAIVGYNTHGGVVGNGDQQVALIVLKPMDQGTKIHITNKDFGKNFALGTDAFPASSGQTGRIDLEFSSAVSPGQIIILEGVNKSSGATASYGELDTDGMFQLKNGEIWYFYVTSDLNPDKPETFCSAFTWGDTWTRGSGGNAYDGIALADLTDGENAMKTDVTNNAWKCGKCLGLTFSLDDALADIESAGLYNGSNPALVLSNSTNAGNGGNWVYYKPNSGSSAPSNSACDLLSLETAYTVTYTPVKYDGSDWRDDSNLLITEPDNKFAKAIEIDASATVISADIYESGQGAGKHKVRAGKLTIKSGTTLEVAAGDTLQVIETLDVEAGGSLLLKASVDADGDISYAEYYSALSSLTPGTEVSVEQYIVKPYWHHLSSPVSTQLKDVQFDNTVTVNGITSTSNFAMRNSSQPIQNVYYWQHEYNQFGWERELDFTNDFSATAYSIYFQPSEIPVLMTATGPLVHPDNAEGNQETSYYTDFLNNTGTATCNSPGYGAPGFWTTGSGVSGACLASNYTGWNFIRNPYAGYMNWKATVTSNSGAIDYQNNPLYNTTVYVWNPDAGATYTASNGVDPVTVYGKYEYANVLSNDVDKLSISPFQAFFVKQESWVDILDKTVKNPWKYDGCAMGKASADGLKWKTAGNQFDGVRFKIQVADLNNRKDDVLMYFGDRGSNYFDRSYDAPKHVAVALDVPMVGTFKDSIMMGIDARENVTAPMTIPLSVINSIQGNNLTLSFLPIENIPFSVQVKDKITNTVHDFKNGIYNFQNDTNYYDNRFELLINHVAVGIDENYNAGSEFKSYFSHGELKLISDSDLGSCTLLISNSIGQTLMQRSIEMNEASKFNFQIEATGVIIVSIITHDGKIYSQKIMR